MGGGGGGASVGVGTGVSVGIRVAVGVWVGDGVQVGTRVLVAVGARVAVDVSVAGNTGFPSAPDGTMVGEACPTDTAVGEPIGVAGNCHANPAPASASVAGSLSAVGAETAIQRPRFIVKAKATVQMLTVASPNINRISCCRRVIFHLLHIQCSFYVYSLYVYFTINPRFFKWELGRNRVRIRHHHYMWCSRDHLPTTIG